LPVVVYGCEAWSLAFTDERRLRAFEERLLRKIFGLKRTRQQESEENCTILLGRSNQGGGDRCGMTYPGEERNAYRILVGKTRQETTWKTNAQLQGC
jgi:hypothetical protein